MAQNIKKRPADINQRAKLIVDIAIGDEEDPISDEKKEIFIESGRRGGYI